jgi:hypothetical protein
MDLATAMQAADIEGGALLLRRLRKLRITTVNDVKEAHIKIVLDSVPEAAFCTIAAKAKRWLLSIREQDPSTDTNALPTWHIEKVCRHPRWCSSEDVVQAIIEVSMRNQSFNNDEIK